GRRLNLLQSEAVSPMRKRMDCNSVGLIVARPHEGRRFSFISVLTLTCIAACSEAPHTLTTPASVTHVNITDEHGFHVLKRIDSASDITGIIRFANEHRSGWTAPWAS